MNTNDYHKKLQDILNDSNKFRILKKDPTEKLKMKVNSLIQTLHMTIEQSKSIPKQTGHFTPAYIYGNPKIHKNIKDHKLRPIISQVSTPTYNLSKYLKRIISPYMPRKYVLASTYEFLDLIRATETSGGVMVSLDVESLFTNVPVEDTTQIVIL